MIVRVGQSCTLNTFLFLSKLSLVQRIVEQQKTNRTPWTILNGKSLSKWQNRKLKHIQLMDNNCHIPDLVQDFSYVENGGLILVS